MDSQPARVKVYTIGPDVTAPELLPLNITGLSTEKCWKKVNGKIVLSVIVDETGQPRNLTLLNTNDMELDPLAFRIVAADRFKPGMYDGAPVLVAVSVEVNLQACFEDTVNSVGMKNNPIGLRSQPVQKLRTISKPPEESVHIAVDSYWKDSKNLEIASVPVFRVGGGVTAPVVLSSPEARFSDEARSAKYQGTCLISLIVDEHGMPQNLRVVKKLDYGLSEKALEAVSKYRFKPAMKDDQPVPVLVNVEVNFHLY
jgi:TonB family protein